MRALPALCLAVLMPAIALAHGPLPEATALSGDPLGVVRTTHGLLWKGVDWRWVCPQVFAPAYAGDPVQLPGGRVLVATTQGVRWSDDGCTWMWSEGIESYVIQIERDIDGSLWAITQSEVLRSYDDGVLWESVDAVAEGASLRAFVRTADHWAIAGWLSNAAVVWIGSPGGSWTTAEVPFAVGQLMEPLGLGADGQAWFNYPMQSIGTVLRISAVGTIELMAESIGDVAGMMVIDGEHLLATRDGLFRSQDGGIWTAIDDVGLNCVVNHDGSWFGCLDALADVGAVGQWSGDHWQTTLQFADVAGPMDCPVPTDGSAEACDEEWKAVQAAFLLRLDPPTVPQEPKEEHKEEPASSCSLVTGSHKSWWLGLLALAVFRRRHHKARPD